MTQTTNKPVFRFAPSPNGYLHLGHAFSALYTWQKAQECGGTFLLRIEDIDIERSKEKYIDQIYDDLAWLGLSWDEPVLRQSSRFHKYEEALSRLRQKDLIYPSSLTRKDIQEIVSTRIKDPDGAPRITRDDEPDTPAEETAWRLDMPKALKHLNKQASFTEQGIGPDGETGQLAIKPQIWGNTVLARKHTPTSYHLSVVLDDSYQNVTHVTRGQDLYHATYIHILLQKLLDLPTPTYDHHSLIDDHKGRKLSKSAGDQSLKAMRREGITRDDILEILPIKL